VGWQISGLGGLLSLGDEPHSPPPVGAICALIFAHKSSFSPRGAGDPVALLPKRRSARYNSTVRNCQLVYWYVGNVRSDTKPDPRVLGLPCRFPATPSILAGRRTQVYDCKRFFGARGARKNFYPEFSRAAGKDRGGPTRPAFRPLALLRWGEDQGLCPVMQALPAAVALAETCR
jgi:hypothetical protein